MTGSSDLEHVRAIAKSYFDAHEQPLPAHDWHHVQRVETLAERLAADRSVDDRVLGPAVLLHDIGAGRRMPARSRITLRGVARKRDGFSRGPKRSISSATTEPG